MEEAFLFMIGNRSGRVDLPLARQVYSTRTHKKRTKVRAYICTNGRDYGMIITGFDFYMPRFCFGEWKSLVEMVYNRLCIHKFAAKTCKSVLHSFFREGIIL